jgi:hypothetical protein
MIIEDGATTHARVKMEEEDQSDVEMIIDHSDYAPLSGNELYDKWKANRKVLPEAFHRLLDPDLGDEQLRGDLFSAEDEQAMEQYAWAIPDDRALAICQAFAPIVEMGAGAGYVCTSLLGVCVWILKHPATKNLTIFFSCLFFIFHFFLFSGCGNAPFFWFPVIDYL